MSYFGKERRNTMADKQSPAMIFDARFWVLDDQHLRTRQDIIEYRASSIEYQ